MLALTDSPCRGGTPSHPALIRLDLGGGAASIDTRGHRIPEGRPAEKERVRAAFKRERWVDWSCSSQSLSLSLCLSLASFDGQQEGDRSLRKEKRNPNPPAAAAIDGARATIVLLLTAKPRHRRVRGGLMQWLHGGEGCSNAGWEGREAALTQWVRPSQSNEPSDGQSSWPRPLSPKEESTNGVGLTCALR